jgi:hypothetical protein
MAARDIGVLRRFPQSIRGLGACVFDLVDVSLSV